MPQITYQNFSLRIARKDEVNKTYSVSVQGAPGGENSAEFSIKDLEIQTSAISLSVNGQTSGLVVSRNAKLVSAPAPGSDAQVQRVQPPDYS